MRTRPLLFTVLTLLLANGVSRAEPPTDYQKLADRTEWGWREELANPMGCLYQCGDKYDVRLVSPKSDRMAIEIAVLLDGKTVYSLRGHRYSVFRILNDRLYYADFGYSSSGGEIVAVDLTTGKELWRTPLMALEGVKHSAYLNRMTLDVNNDVVTIDGNESLGQYLEYKDVQTGKTVGHRIFTKFGAPYKPVEPPPAR